MKKHNATRVLGRRVWLIVLLSTAGLSAASSAQAANSVTMKFHYTVIQGTCEVGINGMNNGVLTIPDITLPGDAGGKPWIGYGPNNSNVSTPGSSFPFVINLTNCSGAPVSGKTPALTMTGSHAGITDSVSQQFVFRDASSTSQGFGFVFYNHSGTTYDPGSEIQDSTAGSNRQYITIPGNGEGTALNGNYTVSLTGAVSCGQCKQSLSQVGTLAATVTFNFVYH